MEAVAFSIGGIFAIGLLVSGIVLTVITMIRIHNGKIRLPSWGKFLVCAAMILMLVIQIASMLPPDIVRLDNPFEVEQTTPVSQSNHETTQAAP